MNLVPRNFLFLSALTVVSVAAPVFPQTSRSTSSHPASAPAAPSAASTPEAAKPSSVDASGQDLVDAMMATMGGRDALGKISTLRFTFAISTKDTVRSSRTHWWNRKTNQYRVQGVNREGKTYVIAMNLDSRKGEASLDGTRLDGEEASKYLERGYGLFINDSYWLLMPLKLHDPGVHLQRDGEVTVGSSLCDRVRVTFDKVGLTPGDTYWLYIDRNSHKMLRWGFILQDQKEPESKYDWTGWSAFDGVEIASDRVKVEDPNKTKILFGNLEVNAPLSEALFDDLKPVKF